MTHILFSGRVATTVTIGRFIAMIDRRVRKPWRPHPQGAQITMHRSDLSYAICTRTDVTLNGVTYEGQPENIKIFTPGKLVPLERLFQSFGTDEDDMIKGLRKRYADMNITQAVDFGGVYDAYDCGRYGIIVDESTVFRLPE